MAKVRYIVNYNGRNYEHPLHSNKRYFIRNVADVVNILEYCATQDLKRDNGLYENPEKLYNFSVTRLVNDEADTTTDGLHNSLMLNDLMKKLVAQIVNDNKLRQS